MSDIGTITEIEPEDGLGWIDLEDSSRVRFGVTACKGFVPAIGMVVRVMGTRPGYGGTVKATELERVADAPKAAFAVEAKPGAAPPPPRTSLHDAQSSGVRADDVLLAILGRSDADDALHANLVAIGFHVKTAPGLKLGCRNPWFYAIAGDGRGNYYGLYAHPMFAGQAVQPWVLFDHYANTLRWIAEDAAGLFPRLLASASAAGVAAETIARVRHDLVKLGVPEVQGQPLEGGDKMTWLPPDEVEIRPLDDYLAETDGGEMERGLLAHAYGRGDARAAEALRSIYATWEWNLPSWVG
jgi:hypothetical protein